MKCTFYVHIYIFIYVHFMYIFMYIYVLQKPLNMNIRFVSVHFLFCKLRRQKEHANVCNLYLYFCAILNILVLIPQILSIN